MDKAPVHTRHAARRRPLHLFHAYFHASFMIDASMSLVQTAQSIPLLTNLR